MKSMVVLFALAAVACGSLVPLAQPPHHPAIVLDPHGRPLDTAEVINSRALHLQAKALEGHYAPLAHTAVVAPYAGPVIAHSAYASPLLTHAALGYAGHGYGHYLKKRSLGHLAYAAPVVAHVGPSAVSHQSRLDVISSPAVVSHAYAAPVVSHAYAAPVLAHASPVVAVAPSAVSHQSRVDVRNSPAVIAHAAPAYATHGYATYGAHAGLLRSTPFAHAW